MNECGLPTIKGTMSMTKLKNALKKIDPDLVFDLRNIRINGQLQGCSGFVTDPSTDKIVYASTDCNHGSSLDHAYIRNAAHTKDCRGGRNRFHSYAELPAAIIKLLRDRGDDS